MFKKFIVNDKVVFFYKSIDEYKERYFVFCIFKLLLDEKLSLN